MNSSDEQLKNLAYAIQNEIKKINTKDFPIHIHTSRCLGNEISKFYLTKEDWLCHCDPTQLVSWLVVENEFDTYKIEVHSEKLAIDGTFDADSAQEAWNNFCSILSMIKNQNDSIAFYDSIKRI